MIKRIFIAMLALVFWGWPVYAEDGHGEHAHEQDAHKDVVKLTLKEQKAFGVETAIAAPGDLEAHVSLSGEVVVNPDRFAHIVPRVAGVVRKVDKNLGDEVKAGDVMAMIESL